MVCRDPDLGVDTETKASSTKRHTESVGDQAGVAQRLEDRCAVGGEANARKRNPFWPESFHPGLDTHVASRRQILERNKCVPGRPPEAATVASLVVVKTGDESGLVAALEVDECDPGLAVGQIRGKPGNEDRQEHDGDDCPFRVSVFQGERILANPACRTRADRSTTAVEYNSAPTRQMSDFEIDHKSAAKGRGKNNYQVFVVIHLLQG